jgi:drug/metabolite transporter (DMT)-like permease
MATLSENVFDRNRRDEGVAAVTYDVPVIRITMNRSDWLTLIAMALIWGVAFLFIRIAVQEVAPLTYVWLRLTLAAAAMWLFLWWRGGSAGLPRQVWGAILVLALFNNAIPFVLFGWGQTHIASGLAAILNATTPIWGVVVAHLFTGDEKLTGRKLAGVALGFAGVTMMIGPALLGSLGTNLLAQLACVAAALCYAFAGVWARRFRAMGISPISVTTGQLTAGALVMTPVALLIDRPWLEAMPSLKAIGAIVALAVVCSAFAYILYFRLIDRAGATNALLVTLLVPPVAIFFGSMVLHEVIEPRDFAGLGLIALGLAAIDGRLLKLVSAGSARQAA